MKVRILNPAVFAGEGKCCSLSLIQNLRFLMYCLMFFLDNSHYRIINSAIQHGIRSTLVIRESLKTDFGTYTCSIENAHGTKELHIRLQQKSEFFK